MTMQFRWYSMVNSYNKSYADFGNGVGIQTDNLRTTDTDWFRTKGAVSNNKLIEVLNEAMPSRVPKKKVILEEHLLRKYFPAYYTEAEMKNIVINLLEQLKKAEEAAAEGR